VQRTVVAFAEGIAWPREIWRGIGIVLASAAIKLIAATQLLWAGLAIAALLEPAQYLFMVVFLGFLIILGHFIRFIGSFVIGGVFALGLFGVRAEPALAIVLIVETTSLLSVAAVGALSLWAQGVALGDLRDAPGDTALDKAVESSGGFWLSARDWLRARRLAHAPPARSIRDRATPAPAAGPARCGWPKEPTQRSMPMSVVERG
jgi:hypothetical protein